MVQFRHSRRKKKNRLLSLLSGKSSITMSFFAIVAFYLLFSFFLVHQHEAIGIDSSTSDVNKLALAPKPKYNPAQVKEGNHSVPVVANQRALSKKDNKKSDKKLYDKRSDKKVVAEKHAKKNANENKNKNENNSKNKSENKNGNDINNAIAPSAKDPVADIVKKHAKKDANDNENDSAGENDNDTDNAIALSAKDPVADGDNEGRMAKTAADGGGTILTNKNKHDGDNHDKDLPKQDDESDDEYDDEYDDESDEDEDDDVPEDDDQRNDDQNQNQNENGEKGKKVPTHQEAIRRKHEEREKRKPKDKEKFYNIWYAMKDVDGRVLLPKAKTLPSDYVMNNSPVDVLNRKFRPSSLRRPANLTNELPYLGVLLDAGRHYFPVDWIKRMIHVLSIMNFNYLHFRLTDDQTFNVQLKSQPMLAYPTTLNNNTKVYSPSELRDIVKYAKNKGIHVIPEINVPGHSASWGGVPGLILQCPNFICRQGYGVPLNISHPMLRPILKDVLKEVIDIFDDPPYLHLGGDEVNMANPCFREIGEEMFDYNDFESILQEILLEIKYNESRVVRWEMSHVIRDLKRAGQITHFWLRKPGTKEWEENYDSKTFNQSIFLSSDIYFDTNQEDSAFDVYVKTKRLKHNEHHQSPILGIVGGTFELSTDFWHDRNVIGKLLAVSMGVSGINTTDRFEFFDSYKEICRSAGFPGTMCSLYGHAPRRYNDFRSELKGPGGVWDEWINNTCNRLTEKKDELMFTNPGVDQYQTMLAMNNFFQTYYERPKWQVLDVANIENRLVKHIGVIMDFAKHPLDGEGTIDSILFKTMVPLGLNTIQLRLVTDASFSYFSYVLPKLQHKNSFYTSKRLVANYPNFSGLNKLKEAAAKHGIVIIPEIAISTNAGGMYKSGFNVACPKFLCEHGKYIPQNILSANYPPMVYSLVEELSGLSTSPYIHLGYDERNMSMPCILEASEGRVTPDFDKFETTIENMLRFANITSDRVIRWENKEKTHYPSRFGDITQCVAGETCRLSTSNNDNTKSPWFGTVDIRVGGAYEIYSKTHELASLSPLGIMAEIGSMRESDQMNSEGSIDYQLLAFTMGNMDLPPMSEEEFQELYIRNCEKGIAGGDSIAGGRESLCKIFAITIPDTSVTEDLRKTDEKFSEDLRHAMCRERTRNKQTHHMKDPNRIVTAVSMQQPQAIS